MAKTGHPNFDYTVACFWRGIATTFSITGNHSGTSFGQTDAQTFMEGASSPFALSFAPFMASKLKVVGSRYYNGQDSAPVFEATYSTESPAPSTLDCTGVAFGSSLGGDYYPIEMCCVLESNCGFGSTNKPVYNRKYLRGVPADVGVLNFATDGAPSFNFQSAAATAATKMGDGSWYGGRVYISPNARSANNWVAQVEVGNHQKPRGRKRTSATASKSLLETLLQDFTSGVGTGTGLKLLETALEAL